MINLRNRRILVTGGNGFLGRVIVDKLREKEAIVLSPRSSEMNLMDIVDTFIYFYRNKPDIVIHSAAYYGGLGINSTYPADIFFKNTIMYANLFEACKNYWVDRVLCVGTACSYPDGLKTLREEDLWKGPVHKSVQNYGCVKKMMQIGLEAYKKQYGLDGFMVLLANLYGPGDSYNPERSHVVAALIRKFVEAKRENKKSVEVWGSGRPIREFLYVDDAAEGVIRALETYSDIEPLNIGTGQGCCISTLVDFIVEMTKYRGEVKWDSSKPDGQYEKIFDVKKLSEKLNWLPETSLEIGLKKTIKWFEENYDVAIKKW